MAYTEQIMLPSRGIIYRLPNFDWTVNVKPFTTKSYKALLAGNASDIALRQFIDDCLVDCPVKAKNMNQQDMLAILFKTRVMTLGNKLKTEIKCSECDHRETVEYDLNNMDIKYLYTDKYPIPIKLPSGLEIKVRFPTGADVTKAKQEAEKRANIFKKNASDFMQTYTVVSLIDMEDKDFIEKAEWYENLNPCDAIYVDEVFTELVENSFGLQMEQECKCSVCDSVIPYYLSIGGDFFRPYRNVPLGFTSKTGNMAGVIKEPDISE